jgi:hypothetical protein
VQAESRVLEEADHTMLRESWEPENGRRTEHDSALSDGMTRQDGLRHN